MEFKARHWKDGRWSPAPSGVGVEAAHVQAARVKARRVRELKPKVRR